MPITEERKEFLYHRWCEETGDSVGRKWREGLTEDESRMVDEWDRLYCAFVRDLYNDI